MIPFLYLQWGFTRLENGNEVQYCSGQETAQYMHSLIIQWATVEPILCIFSFFKFPLSTSLFFHPNSKSQIGHPIWLNWSISLKRKHGYYFFVVGSETRVALGSIGAAYIAEQNSRHLVFVMHPYKPDQGIFNDPISPVAVQ